MAFLMLTALIIPLSVLGAESEPVRIVPLGDSVDLFIMAGQSNMQGHMGDAAGYPADPSHLDPKIRFYWVTPGLSSSDGQWTTMRPQGGRFPNGHFGPEVAFARLLAANGFHPAIFKYSLGSTGLARDWKARGGKGLYDRMDQEYRKAVSLLKEQGHPVKVRAFVWIQGESDAETSEMAEGYFDRLKILVRDVREHLVGDPALPVILGLDEQHPYVKAHPVVIDAQKRLAQEDGRAIFTSMEGIEKADVSHLTPAGLEKHGQRLFEGFEALLKRSQSTPPAATR